MNVVDGIEYEKAIRTLKQYAEGIEDSEIREAITTVADAAEYVSRLPMACYRQDLNNESDCEYSRFNLCWGRAECTHPCVMQADKARLKAENERNASERKLRQYREAVRPILDNCRKIIKAAEGDEAEGDEAEGEA